MRNTCKMKTLDFNFSKTPKILSKIRSFLDKKWTSFTEDTKSFGENFQLKFQYSLRS